MAETSTLPDYLKSLRGVNQEGREEISIQALAREKDVSQAALYKIEAGSPGRWDTIERAYGELCENDIEFATMLSLWAISHSKRRPKLRHMTAAMSKLEEENEIQVAENLDEVAARLRRLPPPDRRTLMNFIGSFEKNEATRKMAAAWLQATEGT